VNKQLLPGGWRKKVYLLENDGKKQILCLIPKTRISKKRLLWAIRLEEDLSKKGVIRGRKLIDFGEDGSRWRLVLTYLPGEPKWIWGKNESFKVGQLAARLHQVSVAHLDLKPGNILWNREGEIVGVIDFEEARLGKRWFLRDLANTLSWVLTSGGNKESFLAGYSQAGGIANYDKINQYLDQFLAMRAKEGNKQAFLLLAKRRLERYQEEIKKKLLEPKELSSFRRKHRKKRIVFLVGAFELLHWGHLEFLKKAKKRGDLLVVGVASDWSRRELKGKIFPLVGEKTRAETLAFFPFVDAVVIVAENNVLPVLEQLKPDIFYTAQKDWQEGVRKREEATLVKSYGGKIVKARHLAPGISSSAMVEQVALFKIKQLLFGYKERRPLLANLSPKKKKKVILFDQLDRLRERLKKKGQSVVFTSGSFDLFHLGHARFLQKAKSCGDVLVVGVPSNASIRTTKGIGRPIVDQWARAAVVADLACVDYVVIFPQPTVLETLKILRPDVFFTVKEGWNRLVNSAEARLVRDYGGKIIRSERQGPHISASKMIDKAAGELIKARFERLLKLAEETPVLNADFDPHSVESQVNAREKGFYQQVLAEVAKEGKCVFCDLKDKYIIAEQDDVVLTVALFPYINGHLLIIPRRHCQSLKELNLKEWRAVRRLARLGLKLLKERLGIENVWFLEREGEAAGKTVSHLHFHLMPFIPELVNWRYQRITLAPKELAERLRKGIDRC